MRYEPILYALAIAALGALLVLLRRIRARVLVDEAEQALRDEFPEWK